MDILKQRLKGQINTGIAILLWELYPTKSDFAVYQTLILCENTDFFRPIVVTSAKKQYLYTDKN